MINAQNASRNIKLHIIILNIVSYGISNFLINQASKSIEPDTLEVPVIGEITLNDMKGV